LVSLDLQEEAAEVAEGSKATTGSGLIGSIGMRETVSDDFHKKLL
jgi:hypothetical protein